jgi:8-oxo-dGTP pyrophosphatase MutT (NUDIX family)
MELAQPLEKVTAFITRQVRAEAQLLLLQHPYAGNQFPAGTVEPAETSEEAARREVVEETGLKAAKLATLIRAQEDELPPNLLAVRISAPVFARPDPISFQWASIPRGTVVEVTGRQGAGYVQVRYIEYDRFPDTQYVTMEITGWVSEAHLTSRIRRHFYHLTHDAPTDPYWQVAVDNHLFTLFWVPLRDLPPLTPPHDDWLTVFTEYWQPQQSTG